MSRFTPYITWHYTDPYYWKYYYVPGLIFSLKNIFGLRSKKLGDYMGIFGEGFKKYTGFTGSLVIDSLTSSLKDIEYSTMDYYQYQALYLQYTMGADILVHKDIPVLNISDPELRRKLVEKNYRLAEAAIRLGDRLGMEVMLVIHGWNHESYALSAEKYRELGAKYYGIGSLLGIINDKNEIIRIVKTVREILGWKPKLHMFGVTSYPLLKKLKNYVDSADSSTPMRAAVNKEVIIPVKNSLKRVKLWDQKLLEILVEKCNNTVSELAYRVLSSKNYSTLKRRLAILNTYIHLSYFNGETVCRLDEVPRPEY